MDIYICSCMCIEYQHNASTKCRMQTMNVLTYPCGTLRSIHLALQQQGSSKYATYNSILLIGNYDHIPAGILYFLSNTHQVPGIVYLLYVIEDLVPSLIDVSTRKISRKCKRRGYLFTGIFTSHSLSLRPIDSRTSVPQIRGHILTFYYFN